MMICKADFEELFPTIFPTKPKAAPAAKMAAPSAACIDRWESDGGRVLPKPPRKNTPDAGLKGRDTGAPDPMKAFVVLPAVAAYGAALNMLAMYQRMARA